MEIVFLKIKTKIKWLRLRIECDVHSTLQHTEEKNPLRRPLNLRVKEREREVIRASAVLISNVVWHRNGELHCSVKR